jgi:hypothetical protein
MEIKARPTSHSTGRADSISFMVLYCIVAWMLFAARRSIPALGVSASLTMADLIEFPVW